MSRDGRHAAQIANTLWTKQNFHTTHGAEARPSHGIAFPKRDHFPYYRCHRASGHLNVRGEKVEADFFELLESLVPDPAQEAAIETVFREVWLSKQSGASNDAMVLRQQIGRLEQRKGRALEQKVDGGLTVEEYNAIRSKADSDLIDLESRLRRVENRTLDLDTAARYLRHTLWNPRVLVANR